MLYLVKLNIGYQCTRACADCQTQWTGDGFTCFAATGPEHLAVTDSWTSQEAIMSCLQVSDICQQGLAEIRLSTRAVIISTEAKSTKEWLKKTKQNKKTNKGVEIAQLKSRPQSNWNAPVVPKRDLYRDECLKVGQSSFTMVWDYINKILQLIAPKGGSAICGLKEYTNFSVLHYFSAFILYYIKVPL